jgi:metal-sulfur cluster biosynthetic enzyme
MSHDTRIAELRGVLNAIVDPCSAAARSPTGLVDMGIVDGIEQADGAVVVRLHPTFAGCLFAPLFAGEAEQRIAALPWCRSVRVETVADDIWTEERMAPAARSRLERRRGALRSAAT